MPFKLQEISQAAELDEWTPVFWEANIHPPMGGYDALMPVKDNTPEAKAAAIEDAKPRYVGILKDDPNSHLFKVVNTDSNAVIDGGYWEIYKTNPFASPPPDDFEVYW
jgi:hypothetical protein